jgi:NitT/TauT family transport system substrate-binding protein
MLTPSDAELAQIRDMGVKAGILERAIPIDELVDRSFIPADIRPADISVR